MSIYDILNDGLNSRKMIGSQCQVCGKIYFPPSGFCKDCSVFIKQYLDLPDTGVLIQFSKDGLVKSKKKKKKKGDSHITGLVQIDTTETRMMMDILNAKPEDLVEGTKLKAVWKERTGKLIKNYIAGYEPIINK
jgi:uncharacterized OB-fold protein